MVVPFGPGDGDDEEVGDCMVDIDGNVVDEDKVVAVAESKADAVVAEDDPDWLLAMLKYVDDATSGLPLLAQKKKRFEALRSNW